MTPRSVVPNPEGVSNGAPAVGGNGADTPPPAPAHPDRPAILDWAPTVPDERPSEHIRNGLQMLYELETLLQSSGDYGQSRRALLADVKRRLGWALRGLAPHAL